MTRTLPRLTVLLPLLALAACQSSGVGAGPEPAPRTPGAVISTGATVPISDAAAAAAAEARTGIAPADL